MFIWNGTGRTCFLLSESVPGRKYLLKNLRARTDMPNSDTDVLEPFDTSWSSIFCGAYVLRTALNTSMFEFVKLVCAPSIAF